MSLGLDLLTPLQLIEMGELLRNKPKKELEDFLLSLSDEEREELLYSEYVWLRKSQYVPIDLNKNITMILAGRG